MICPRCGTERPDAERRCPSCGLGRAGTISDRAERRICTVLFADITGFTALSELIDAEEVREITNACLEEQVNVIHRYSGTVVKYIGDEVMAAFGAPHAHEDDPERAVAAALEMRQGLTTVSERLGKRLPTPLELHIGINTGMVVAGLVGSSDRSAYDVMGDNVNLAARLVDAAEGGQILVSEATQKVTQHAFSYRSLPPITVKGKRKPVPVFELAGARARRRSQRGLPGIQTPFVGRDAERTLLTGALSFLEAGHGGLVTLSGPAGVGKTRLLSELKTEVDRRGIPWVQAGASGLGEAGVLAIWSDLVRRLLSPEQSGIRGDTNVSLVLPMPARGGAAVFLSEIIGVTLEPQERSRLRQMDEAAVRGQIFLAVRELLKSRAQRGPLILVLEDLHWADQPSFDLLRSVLDVATDLPLLFIGTYRSDATTVPGTLLAADGIPGILRSHVDLAPLTDAECRTLATAVLGTDTETARLRQTVVEQAEGNPFYLEEILRSLAEQGAIAPTRDGWRLAVENLETAVMLPASLQVLLLDRIDRLPEGHKRLLQLASVAGRRFSAELIATIAADTGIDAGGVTDLIRDDFLEGEDDEGMLRFRHALLQEAAYSSLLLSNRRLLHQRVAEALEARPDLWPVRVELPAMLAHHWERAEDWAKAADWAMQAAEYARRTFAPDEAARMYERVFAATRHTGDTALARAALTGIADASLAGGDAERALDVLGQVAEIPGTPLELAAADRRRGQALARSGMQARAGEAFARAAAHLGEPREDEPAEVRAERAVIRIQAAFSHLARGAVLLARAAAEEAVRLQTGGDGEADARRLLGVIEQLDGNDERAAGHFEAALAIAEPLGDVPREATIREQLGILRAGSGNRGEGWALLRRALDDYRRLGDHAGAARCLLQLAQIRLYEGALAEALALLDEGATEAATGAEPEVGARIGLVLGRALALGGRWDDARAAFERAGADDDQAAGEAALELTLIELARSRAPEGELRAMLTAAEQAGQRGAADRARLGLAMIARRTGRAGEARALLRAVIEDAPNPNAQSVIEARIGLAYVAAGESRPEIAIAVATQARAAAEEHAPAATRWYARRVLGVSLQAAGRTKEAEPILRGVVEETRQAGVLTELGAALSAWARARRDLGDPTGGADALAELRTVAAMLSGQGTPTGTAGHTIR